MKLRIKGNTLRLRLLRSEVESFAAEGAISDEINFGGQSLQYTLRSSNDADSTNATMNKNEIIVTVPERESKDWASSDRVGIEVAQPLGGGETLSILIEKDFVCVGRPDDPDRADAFSAQ